MIEADSAQWIYRGTSFLKYIIFFLEIFRADDVRLETNACQIS